MLTLAKLAIALAVTALLGSSIVAPAPQAPTIMAIVPFITVIDTYTDKHGSLTTATITISEFYGSPLKNIVVCTLSGDNKNTKTTITGLTNHQTLHHKPTESCISDPSKSTS